MSKIIWDKTGERLYETGCDHGVLYPMQTGGVYNKGVAWNGLTAVTESPSGAEASPIYADNIKYVNLVSNEEFGATVEAYMYPDEFAECDGSVEIMPGMYAGQQSRKTFGLAYRTILGNDTDLNDYGYKLHLVYGCLAAPSEKGYSTVNDSPEAATLSWEISTTPVSINKLVNGKKLKPTATLIFDSTKFSAEFMTKLEEILYGKDPTTDGGNDGVEPRLPLPDEIAQLLNVACGGTIWQDFSLIPGKTLDHMQQTDVRSDISHKIRIGRTGHLRKCLGTSLYVNSFHHQAVNLTGKGIIVTARACDETIEAIELKDYPFGVGVQWHPECMFRTSPEMRTLFKNFVEHCSVSGE